MLLKRKSCDNHHPKLHLGQFDFHLHASSSLTSIDPRFLLTLHTQFLTVYATRLAGYLCTSRKNIPAMVSICTSSTCQGIRLSSSLMKLSALSSVLVRILARWWKSDTSKPSVLAKVLARWLGSWRVTRDDLNLTYVYIWNNFGTIEGSAKDGLSPGYEIGKRQPNL